MRVLLTGGGTGGHIYPALAIAAELKRRVPGCELLYVGTREGLESRIVPRAGLPFATVSARGLMRKGPREMAAGLLSLTRGLWQADRILARFRPDVVVGTGGYVAAPVALAAVRRRIPVVIQEQNAVPGATNRLLARWARAVCVPFADAGRFFPAGTPLVVTGNPVRPEIVTVTREAARARLGLDRAEPVVLVTGGSRGAERINRAALELAVAVTGWQEGVLLWACGERYHAEFRSRLEQRLAEVGRPAGRRVRLFPYIDDMPAAYAAADLYVGRAGATTLAEITVRGLPAVLVPSPHVAHHEQDENARVLERAGAAVVIPDAECTGPRLVALVQELLQAPDRLATMARASRQLGRPDATAAIVERVLEVARAALPAESR
ncbi:UDP-N-acetylglucosamine--N-acetylmuramyl- (pentapeptide) pyrophosphoryl-undecaprenol N-acetylglucosamine transferase [Thermaerobacter marianensis DSM 12885]|uniref:UDP-N-acetylglucosamine--N-acetylmuramyl-(pentapeptide) pyrophosphoryl-undecaprenol N-acetylglucosamine transferase n=1 Tax=Thermaerobacter marianensis (strain ATCC 700841 / DSM 12885 / JCM 10246 / 7p75a) TaxID=644966 RepID=E6SIY8_THEM7|nr:undecaprenyldiphospho-muramoylpentapeptide beta-N-acetylglucosaminyltransferase [Thermaerobacter marianensis]ADU50983.1 UDP-N-acetylglucosamine--N-acetylmuramyl- (pentapeptide) pyrophosphoryl-undecaprenol N-acetylglucosamine transferase [Thermaerobacter marianensis DSM 12885]